MRPLPLLDQSTQSLSQTAGFDDEKRCRFSQKPQGLFQKSGSAFF